MITMVKSPSVAFAPTVGKFDCERDAMLHRMSLELWANESDGDVESAQGYFARISVSPAELHEIIGAFGSDAPFGFEFASLIGHYLLREDSQGFVTVTQFATEYEVEREFHALFNAYFSDIDF